MGLLLGKGGLWGQTIRDIRRKIIGQGLAGC